MTCPLEDQKISATAVPQRHAVRYNRLKLFFVSFECSNTSRIPRLANKILAPPSGIFSLQCGIDGQDSRYSKQYADNKNPKLKFLPE